MAALEISFDISEKPVNVRIDPATRYSPTALKLDSAQGEVTVHAREDQLADIVEAITRHLQAVRYYKYPDGGRILAAECTAAIEADAHEIPLAQSAV